MGVKTGPRLVVDHMITYQLLGMQDFWDLMPGVFDDLWPLFGECRDKATKVAMGQGCGGCTSVKSAMTPAHNALWSRVALLPDPSPVVDFIAAKRGYRPSPVEVYYRDEAGATHALRL